MADAEAPTTTTKTKGKKNKPKVSEFPKVFTKGIRVRSAYTLRAKNVDEDKVPDLPENFVAWEETDADSFDAVVAYVGDKEALRKYVLKGLNDSVRQNAAFGARKFVRMVSDLMKANKKLTREKAEKLMRAAYSAV